MADRCDPMFAYLAEQEDRLLQLVLQNLGLDLLQRLAIDADQATAALAVRNSGSGFLRVEKCIRLATVPDTNAYSGSLNAVRQWDTFSTGVW